MVLSKDLKLAICFGLIMGVIISVFNLCFASEIEDLTPSVLTNAHINSTGYIQEWNGRNLYYIQIEPGYRYYFKNVASSYKPIGFSNSVDYGVSVFGFSNVDSGDTFSFNGGEYGYLFFDSSALGNNGIGYFSREKLEGMTGFVDNLAYDLSYANLSGVLFFVVPIMAIGILFALGFYLLKRLLNKIKRAKGGA